MYSFLHCKWYDSYPTLSKGTVFILYVSAINMAISKVAGCPDPIVWSACFPDLNPFDYYLRGI